MPARRRHRTRRLTRAERAARSAADRRAALLRPGDVLDRDALWHVAACGGRHAGRCCGCFTEEGDRCCVA